MLLKELRDRMVRELSGIYPKNESIAIARALVLSVTGFDAKDIVLDPDIEVDEALLTTISNKMNELMAHKPLPYVIGQASFYGLELEVDSSVLIPRPETEELVKWISVDQKSNSGLRVLDIGTGSGCIILALGKLLVDPQLTAIDISDTALRVASGNAAKYSIPVKFLRKDILNEKQWDSSGKFDLIVSNPPYVRESEKVLIRPNVLDYEPHKALFVPDDDPLVFYRAIAGFCKRNLNENGSLYLEINENLGEEVVWLLTDLGFIAIVLKKDIQGKDRMVAAKIEKSPH
jgi:release factor glutamine methyltransferase